MKSLPTPHHRIAGPEGAPWITFVPGIGNDITFWRAQADALSSHFRVLCFDPWGHGDSPLPPEGCSFADIVDGVVQLWDTLGVDRSAVVGLGFGGSVGLALAARFPRRVTRLAACCCRPRQPDDRRDFWRARQATARVQGIEALADATVDRWLDPAFRAAHPDIDARLRAMMKRTSVDGYCAYVSAFVEMDLEDEVQAIRIPTLLVAAEHDHGGGPVPAMLELAERIPGARLQVLDGTGHICNHEVPQTLNRVFAGFLGDSDN